MSLNSPFVKYEIALIILDLVYTETISSLEAFIKLLIIKGVLNLILNAAILIYFILH